MGNLVFPIWWKILRCFLPYYLALGFSFYIQNDNQGKKGNDFRLRFLWQLLLLLGFGILNTVFYEGDILVLYAILGVVLILVCKWNDKAVFITALILMLQTLKWMKYFYMLLHPEFGSNAQFIESLFWDDGDYLKSNSFMDYAIGNLTIERWASIFWSWENGRFFQAPALFMFGMLLGRKKLFIASVESNVFWKKALQYAIVLFIPLFAFKTFLPELIEQKALATSLQ